jgi:hypothetical protein
MAVRMPPEQRRTTFVFADVVTGATVSGAVGDLPYGFDAEFKAGQYYRDVDGREYFCEEVTNAECRVVLLGSIQHGIQLWGEALFRLEDGRGKYENVTNPADLERLEQLRRIWIEAKRSGRVRTSGFHHGRGSRGSDHSARLLVRAEGVIGGPLRSMPRVRDRSASGG